MVKDSELARLRQELDEHLDAVNQNTSEVGAVYEYAGELDLRLEKLAERVDALQALLLAQDGKRTRSVRLSLKEREVFSVLKTVVEPLTSVDVGRRVGLTSDVVAQTLYCLKQKGVPVLAQDVDSQTYYALDEAYRNEQEIMK